MSMTNFRPLWRARFHEVRGPRLLATMLWLMPLAADAQQPTAQQQNAIRQSCRSDFQANCAGVPTGGSEALQCLKQSYSKVSPECQKALTPVMGGAAAQATGGAPAGAGTPAPAAPPASPPPTGSAAGQSAGTNSGQPASMREEVMLTRELCGPEFRSYCANVQLGGGRAMQCLESNAAYLSPRCKRALAEIRSRS